MNTSNQFQVRNGSAYAATTTISYAANTTYHVKIVANLTAKTYDVWINGTQIAATYSFRTEAATMDDVGQVCLKATTGANVYTVANHIVYPQPSPTPTTSATLSPGITPSATPSAVTGTLAVNLNCSVTTGDSNGHWGLIIWVTNNSGTYVDTVYYYTQYFYYSFDPLWAENTTDGTTGPTTVVTTNTAVTKTWNCKSSTNASLMPGNYNVYVCIQRHYTSSGLNKYTTYRGTIALGTGSTTVNSWTETSTNESSNKPVLTTTSSLVYTP